MKSEIVWLKLMPWCCNSFCLIQVVTFWRYLIQVGTLQLMAALLPNWQARNFWCKSWKPSTSKTMLPSLSTTTASKSLSKMPSHSRKVRNILILNLLRTKLYFYPATCYFGDLINWTLNTMQYWISHSFGLQKVLFTCTCLEGAWVNSL